MGLGFCPETDANCQNDEDCRKTCNNIRCMRDKCIFLTPLESRFLSKDIERQQKNNNSSKPVALNVERSFKQSVNSSFRPFMPTATDILIPHSKKPLKLKKKKIKKRKSRNGNNRKRMREFKDEKKDTDTKKSKRRRNGNSTGKPLLFQRPR